MTWHAVQRQPKFASPGDIVGEFRSRQMAESFAKSMGREYTLTAGVHYAWAVRRRVTVTVDLTLANHGRRQTANEVTP